MTDKEKVILSKICKHITSALTFVQNMNYDEYISDEKTVSATAFVIGQIGELTRLLSLEIQDTYPEIPWKALRGMRNRIIHDYENVDLIILWETISEDLPVLLTQLREITKETDELCVK